MKKLVITLSAIFILFAGMTCFWYFTQGESMMKSEMVIPGLELTASQASVNYKEAASLKKTQAYDNRNTKEINLVEQARIDLNKSPKNIASAMGNIASGGEKITPTMPGYNELYTDNTSSSVSYSNDKPSNSTSPSSSSTWKAPVLKKNSGTEKPVERVNSTPAAVDLGFKVSESDQATGTVAGSDDTRAIDAVVYGNYKISGSDNIRLRLIQDAVINGVTFKRNSILTGRAIAGYGRAEIQVSFIAAGNSTMPVNLFALDAYDMQRGIIVDNSDGAEVANNAGTSTAVDAVSSVTSELGALGRGASAVLRGSAGKKVSSVNIYDGYKIKLITGVIE